MESTSWASVAALPTTLEGLQFGIRTNNTKGKNLASSIIKRTLVCTGIHCQSLPNKCELKTCRSRMQTQLDEAEGQAKALTAGLPDQLAVLKKLKADIELHCRLDKLQDDDMESLWKAVTTAMRARAKTSFCDCLYCRLNVAKQECQICQQRVDAVQRRITALQEYRRANDRETIARVSSK
jgi:hypothetical protein